MPQHGDVQALLVCKVFHLPLLVVDERAGVGQPQLLRVSLRSADKTFSLKVPFRLGADQKLLGPDGGT